MSDREIKPTVLIEEKTRRSPLPRILLVVACVVLVGAGLLLSFWGSGKTVTNTNISTSDQPLGGVFSGGRQTASPSAGGGTDSGKPSAAGSGQQSANQANAQSAAQSADQAAAQADFERAQRDQQIAAQKAELDRMGAEQAAAARRNQEEAARLQAERDRIAMQQQRASASIPQNVPQQQTAPQVYDGPSSGSLVWEGEVQGVTLVTIMGGKVDQGRIVSGSLPGVSVSLQPKDGKHVIIAAPPSPSNRYQRLAFRVQGKGTVQQTILWTVN